MFLLLLLLLLLSMAIDVVIKGLDETQARRGNGSPLLCRTFPGADETFLLEKMAPETRDGIRLPGRQRY